MYLAPKGLLIVLDNCENLLATSSRPWLSDRHAPSAYRGARHEPRALGDGGVADIGHCQADGNPTVGVGPREVVKKPTSSSWRRRSGRRRPDGARRARWASKVDSADEIEVTEIEDGS
jgi:hypothetical protein